jgi:hypothetical protein
VCVFRGGWIRLIIKLRRQQRRLKRGFLIGGSRYVLDLLSAQLKLPIGGGRELLLLV